MKRVCYRFFSGYYVRTLATIIDRYAQLLRYKCIKKGERNIIVQDKLSAQTDEVRVRNWGRHNEELKWERMNGEMDMERNHQR